MTTVTASFLAVRSSFIFFSVVLVGEGPVTVAMGRASTTACSWENMVLNWFRRWRASLGSIKVKRSFLDLGSQEGERRGEGFLLPALAHSLVRHLYRSFEVVVIE